MPKCPNGSRRNTHTGICTKTNKIEHTQNKIGRCPRGTRRNTKTKLCENTITNQPHRKTVTLNSKKGVQPLPNPPPFKEVTTGKGGKGLGAVKRKIMVFRPSLFTITLDPHNGNPTSSQNQTPKQFEKSLKEQLNNADRSVQQSAFNAYYKIINTEDRDIAKQDHIHFTDSMNEAKDAGWKLCVTQTLNTD